MGFRVPSFNLTCNIWSRASVPAGPVDVTTLPPPRIADQECQLRAPGKMSTAQDEANFWIFCPMLLLPAGTDVRDDFSWDGVAMNKPDFIEVPVGSGRGYTVVMVDDVGKGFANEYRFAFIMKNAHWPIPAP